MNRPPPSVLLFDLGGVLIENTTFQELPTLLRQPMAAGALVDRWLDSPAVRDFERGLMVSEDFAAAFAGEWDLAISPEQFLTAFAAWPKGPYPGALDLLERLRTNFTIAFLSNCNEIHWRRLDYVIGYADLAFSSHHFGVVKPDTEIFERVIRELDCPPEHVCFFDDSIKNVKAARAIGMNAHQTIGFDALADTISSLGLTAAQSRTPKPDLPKLVRLDRRGMA